MSLVEPNPKKTKSKNPEILFTLAKDKATIRGKICQRSENLSIFQSVAEHNKDTAKKNQTEPDRINVPHKEEIEFSCLLEKIQMSLEEAKMDSKLESTISQQETEKYKEPSGEGDQTTNDLEWSSFDRAVFWSKDWSDLFPSPTHSRSIEWKPQEPFRNATVLSLPFSTWRMAGMSILFAVYFWFAERCRSFKARNRNKSADMNS